MKKLITILLAAVLLSGCESVERFAYKDVWEQPTKQILIGGAIIIVVTTAAGFIRSAESYSGSGAEGYAWDKQSDGTWVCRDTGGVGGGEYAHHSNCAGSPLIDNWR